MNLLSVIKGWKFQSGCCITIRLFVLVVLGCIYCTEKNHKHGKDKSHNQENRKQQIKII